MLQQALLYHQVCTRLQWLVPATTYSSGQLPCCCCYAWTAAGASCCAAAHARSTAQARWRRAPAAGQRVWVDGTAQVLSSERSSSGAAGRRQRPVLGPDIIRLPVYPAHSPPGAPAVCEESNWTELTFATHSEVWLQNQDQLFTCSPPLGVVKTRCMRLMLASLQVRVRVDGIAAECTGDCAYAASAQLTPNVTLVNVTHLANGSRQLSLEGSGLATELGSTHVEVAEQVRPGFPAAACLSTACCAHGSCMICLVHHTERWSLCWAAHLT